MFTIKRKLYSRHTPKDLEEYRNLSEEDIKRMSRGQRLQYLEDEYEKANRNETKYLRKKSMKWGLGGAIAGASAAKALGAPLATGAIIGGAYGAIGGSIRGYHKARKEGHDKEKISLKNSRKLDEIARKLKQDDDYEVYVKRMIRDRNTERNATQARNMAFYAALK